MRGGLVLVLAVFLAAALAAQTVDFVETTGPAPQSDDRSGPAWPILARLSGPTDRYDHDVLGGIPAWSQLTVQARSCGECRHGFEARTAQLPANLVFEDVAPRLWDVSGDGRPEIVVVESDVALGARLAVWRYSETGADLTRWAATDFIGTRHRWLAPAGVGDFDGDGRIEIAYVDRPHLTKDLVFVQLDGNSLREVDRVPGLTNHRIGDAFISGGARNCGAGDEVILANAGWTRLMAVRIGQPPVDLGAYSKAALRRALACT